MTDELLPYYNRELSYFRRLADEFAKKNPKIAGRLRLGPESSDDPHVERLIEAFAFLNARIRYKLDDDFPELTDALLSILYPHLVAPIPSTAIVQFELDRRQAKLTAGHKVPRESAIETDPIDGEPCRFRTCYDVELWPIEVVAGRVERMPSPSPSTPRSKDAVAVAHIKLRCLSKDVQFGDLEAKSLRFFLRGLPQHAYLLYQMLFNSTLDIALANSASDPDPIVLPAGSIRRVGFARDQGLFPYTARSALSYRLLTEFFTFPEKFLFFDLELPDDQQLQRLGSEVSIFIHLSESSVDLEGNVSRETFRLGCTPVVNLFTQRAEPIQLTQTSTDYRVVPDARRPLATEVYSIDSVVAASPDGSEFEYLPFYSVQHAVSDEERQKFWYPVRRAAEPREGEIDKGTEVFLNLVDLDFTPAPESGWFVDVATTCFNRDLPSRLPFGGGQPRLRLSKGGGAIAKLTCLTAPTPTRRPQRKHGAMWKLVSHLTLGHLSLVDGKDGAAALREILKLYDFADSASTRATIDGILLVNSRRTVARVPSTHGPGICRGVEVEIQFDEDSYGENSLYLFASVLESFLAQYCSINSFTKLVGKLKRREKEFCSWPPRSGERALV